MGQYNSTSYNNVIVQLMYGAVQCKHSTYPLPRASPRHARDNARFACECFSPAILNFLCSRFHHYLPVSRSLRHTTQMFFSKSRNNLHRFILQKKTQKVPTALCPTSPEMLENVTWLEALARRYTVKTVYAELIKR